MVFYLVGIGLGNAGDITVNGLNIVRACAKVYLECYTSILSRGLERKELEEFYGRPVLEADREMVEQHVEQLLEDARGADVALLVVGDPFGATTHADLVLRAREMDVPLKVIHNASILSAVGCCGLQLYNFGATVSIPMWAEGWEPDSFLDKIALNRTNGMHTLCLLDIKVKEQTTENLINGNRVFEPPRFLMCSGATSQILIALDRRRKLEGSKDAPPNLMNAQTPVVGLARIGWADQKIVYCALAEMQSVDLGPPLHALIIPGTDQLHPIEQQMLQTFHLNLSSEIAIKK